MSLFVTHEDGYYALTTAGYMMTGVLIVAAAMVILYISRRGNAAQNEGSGSRTSIRQLTFSGAAIALAFAASYIRIIRMPWGGAVTLCSMLFVTLIGYWYGPKIGFTAAFAYGLLQFIQDGGSYILSPLQACLDYILAFAALGCSGFFHDRKNGLVTGYIVAILARGLLHSIGGYLYWMDYMPENFPASLSAIYPIAYNYAFILAEGVITVILISVPAVKKALQGIKGLATQ